MKKLFQITLLCLFAPATVFGQWIVTNTDDSGAGSLRAMIDSANAYPGADTIRFHSSLTGQTITTTSAELAISDDYTLITGDIDGDGDPDVSITTSYPDNILSVFADNCEIRALHIYGAQSNVFAIRVGGRFGKVSGCYLGTNLAGTAVASVKNYHGLFIEGSDNLAGGKTPGDRNVISGSTGYGIWVRGNNCHRNEILGNYIGTDVTGSVAIPNGSYGIQLNGSSGIPSKYTKIGDGTAEGRNLISGNTSYGVFVVQSDSTIILGNYFGTTADGLNDIGGSQGGAIALQSVNGINIGNGTAEGRNIIAAQEGHGIYSFGSDSGIVITGNYIGVGADGMTFLPNSFEGIRLAGYGHQIGDGSYMGRNIVSGGRSGIYINGEHTSVYRNWIGTDSSLSTDHGGTDNGIEIYGSFHNIQHNTIQGMSKDAIYAEASDSKIHSSFIGNGYSIIPNDGNGVKLANGAERDTILGNEIYDSGLFAIVLDGNGTMDNWIYNNSIYNNDAGAVSITNGAQRGVQPPRLDSLRNGVMYGNAAPNGRVHVYATDNTASLSFIDTTTADETGFWSFTLLESEFLGIAQDSLMNSSEIRFCKLPGALFVSSTDDSEGEPSFGTLRYALDVANNNEKADTIRFDPSLAGQTINLLSSLQLSEGGTMIDGDIDDNGTPDVTITGYGFNISSDNNEVKSLALGGMNTPFAMSGSNNSITSNHIGLNTAGSDTTGLQVYYGINMSGGYDNVISGNVFAGNAMAGTRSIFLTGTARNNVIRANVIGSNPSTTVAYGNNAGGHGIFIAGEAKGNKIGDGTIEGRNFIVANTYAIQMAADSNTVAGNFIGITRDGATAMGNGAGIWITAGTGTRVGNGTLEGRNVVSGNTGEGIVGTVAPTDLVVRGNYVGTDSSGKIDVGNANYGIYLQSSGAVIGGPNSGDGNVVAGNGNDNINLNFTTAAGGIVQNNYVGVGADGISSMGNGASGIHIAFNVKRALVKNNVVGHHTTAGSYGIRTSADSTLIVGNKIGIGPDGVTGIPNRTGLYVQSQFNVIGGTSSADRNYVSGNVTNGFYGISIVAKYNQIIGNVIGLDVNGNALGNYNGLYVQADSNMVGDGTGAGRNIISGNTSQGLIIGPGKGSTVFDNYIGTDETGIAIRPNLRNVLLQTTADYTVVKNNVIVGGGSTVGGIDVNTSFNTITGNRIGVTADDQTVAGNYTGIYVANGKIGNVIGGAGSDRNIIVGSNNWNISLVGAHQTQILNNLIGVKSDGSSGGGSGGVGVQSGASNNYLEGNTIANHLSYGIYLNESTTDSNRFYDNSIYDNAEGITIATGAQQGVAPPEITSVSSTQVTGMSSPFALIQVYSDDGDQGETFIDTTRADGSGNWTLSGSIPGGVNITALQDVDGNTSAFSTPFAQSSPLLVTNTNDAGAGSLREAILYANNNSGPDTITFDAAIAGQVISLSSLLPEITDAGTVIDGDINDDDVASIQINGNGLAEGIVVQSSGNEIRHLSIVDFNTLLKLKGPSSNNKVLGNKLGLTLTDSAAGYGLYGLLVSITCRDNIIGDGTTAGRNYIAGRGATAGNHSAIYVNGTHTHIRGNYIGIKPDGVSTTLNNEGIYLAGDSNFVGDGTFGGRNVIAANQGNSVVIFGVKENRVIGNFIGTNPTGTMDLGAPRGVIIFGGATNNHIGDGSEDGENRIVGANSEGVYITGAGTSNNEIIGNKIGIGTGGEDIGNNYGIRLESSSSNTRVADNVIRFNTTGIAAQGGSSMNTFFQNVYSQNSTDILITAGSQQDVAAPRITSYNESALEGNAAPNALIQVFTYDSEADAYLNADTTRADGLGDWSLDFQFGAGLMFTALQDSNGNTSGFAPFFTPEEGESGALTALTSSVNFGSRRVSVDSTTSELRFVATTSAVEVTRLSIVTASDFFMVSPPSLPVTLTPGLDTLKVTIKFKPTATGARVDTLRVTSDASNGTVSVAMSGTGLENTAPVAQLSILRSTVAKHQIEIYTAADEFIQAISGTATLGSTTPLPFTSVNSQLFVSRYQLSASGTLNINITLSDAAGNVTNPTRSYSVGSLSKDAFQTLASEDRLVEAVAKGSGYLMLGKSSVKPAESTEIVSEVYDVMETDEVSSLRLRFHVPLSTSSKRYAIYQLVDGQWLVVGGTLKNDAVETTVNGGGTYTVLAKDALAFIPQSLELNQNYPNPFNPSTTIRFGLAQAGSVKLTIYNIMGQKVRELVNDIRPAGTFEIVWDGRNASGQGVSTGVYLYRLETLEGVLTRKMMFLK